MGEQTVFLRLGPFTAALTTPFDRVVEELRQLYPEPQLERFTDRTPATVEELSERVRESAALGYAVSEASFERGISVVTAPVRDQTGRIVAALRVAGAYERLFVA